ncbi:Ycf66 family protein [Moorena producens]|uniref:Ycf66 family protein n=1 Tax=Moorena producens TaxID=1155739 RepID=UPI003C719533
MVNFGFNSASLLGIFLMLAGAGLYFLRSVRPELARDHDIFFTVVGVVCGFILVTQGWRLDPILQLSQLLLSGTAIFFGVESLRLRGVATKKAREDAGFEDRQRPVSRNYYREEPQEANVYDEYDELEPVEERYSNPRLRPTADSRERRTERYEVETRRSRSRGSLEESRLEERSRKRRPRSNGQFSERPRETWQAKLDSDWEDRPSRSRRSRPSEQSVERPVERSVDTWEAKLDRDLDTDLDRDLDRDREDRPVRPSRSRRESIENYDSENYDSQIASRERKRRTTPREETSSNYSDQSDYVDYKPIDLSEEEDEPLGPFEY